MSFFQRDKRKPARAGQNSPSIPHAELSTFEEELSALINKYNLEALNNTPDFILAFYLKDCLLAFNSVQQRRKEYFAAREEQKKERESQMAPLSK